MSERRARNGRRNGGDGVVEGEIARIGRRVRSWREADGLTLQELARRSGLATSTVQKIEKAQMVPSVAVILKLARGLHRRASELLYDGSDEVEVLQLRKGERHAVGVSGKLRVERLSADLSEPALEMWRVTLYPGISSGRDAIEYEGEELVVCEAGAVTFRVGEQEYRLEPGDTLHFKASIPHVWRNDDDAPARFTVTGTLPRHLRAAMQRRLAVVSQGARGRRP